MRRQTLLPSLLLALPVVAASAQTSPYAFDGPIDRPTLESVLSRSVTIMGLTGNEGKRDQLRMMLHTGTKFAGRAYTAWGSEAYHVPLIDGSKPLVDTIHALDPDIVLQGTIFEIVTTSLGDVTVPDWAFEEFDLPVEDRAFRYEDMLYTDGRMINHWSPGQSVPDITRPETKLWFYTLGRKYVDAGYDAIHVGQVELIGQTDTGWEHWWDVLSRIRNCARANGRRHLMLLDGHVPSGGLVHGEDELLFDFHSFPLRNRDIPAEPQHTILELGFIDSIYGRSKGGLSPSGWIANSLPYIVEYDNWGRSDREGTPAGDYWAWGYDEIGWFAHQPKEYRDEWLRYAWDWVRANDPNGYVQMPAARCLHAPVDGASWYYANRPSSEIPKGFDHEEAFKACWGQVSWDLTPALAVEGIAEWTCGEAATVAIAGMSGDDGVRVSLNGESLVDLPPGAGDTPFRHVIEAQPGDTVEAVAPIGGDAFVVIIELP